MITDEMTLADARRVIYRAFRDKAPGSTRFGYQSVIACYLMDEWGISHEKANVIADAILYRLFEENEPA